MEEEVRAIVQELIDANECVSILQKDPYLGLVIPSIPLDQLRWAVITDASWANAVGNRSQVGFIVGATIADLWDNKPSIFGVIKIVVRLTLSSFPILFLFCQNYQERLEEKLYRSNFQNSGSRISFKGKVM